MKAFLLVPLLLVGCASSSAVSPRLLLSKSIQHFSSTSPVSSGTKIWLTNQQDSECHVQPDAARGSDLDVLAHEVFTNVITAQKWGALIEGHRHNYATDFKPETHRTVVVAGDEKNAATSSSVEDLCLLDEAKKRHADKVLVYELLASDGLSMLVHFRLSDARSGLIEVSKTLRVFREDVKDWSL